MPNVDQNLQGETHAELEARARTSLDLLMAKIATRNPAGEDTTYPSIAGVDKLIPDIVGRAEPIAIDILRDYSKALKYEADSMAEYSKEIPNYYAKLEQILKMDESNLRALYELPDDNPLRQMLIHQFSHDVGGSAFISDPLNVVKKVYGTNDIPKLLGRADEDPVFASITDALKKGTITIYDLFSADYGFKDHDKQRVREWMRNGLMMATDVRDPDQADAYIFALSRTGMGAYSLDKLVERINSFGAEKLESIRNFSGIVSIASYSDAQLERMYKLSQGEQREVDRLKSHDVIATLINRDGDHNGVSTDIAERLEDDSERTLFFEVSTPQQIHSFLKKLFDLGILPTTLVFASHGSSGQFFIGERPGLDSEETIDHVTVIADQDFADLVTADNDNLKGYDVTRANGLIRAIQRFMQPSRSIDDPDQDSGRKKVVSLSCEFDGEAYRGTLGSNGEKVRGEQTTLLRRFGGALADKLPGEHIDLYGAVISTNQQTKTDRGLHYNQMRDGRWAPYPASVLHIDDGSQQWHRLNEIQLRKVK